MTRTGQAALNWAANQHYHPSRSWYRDCLLFVHDAFDAPSLYGRAITGWYNTNRRHNTWPPPAAVPVWWDGGDGHVAVSIGDGTCWTNDYVRSGRIDRVRIASIGPGWGKHYLGWSEDVNEVHVFKSVLPMIDISNVIHAAKYGGAVTHGSLLKKALASEVGKGNMALGSDTLGRYFRARYKLLQVKWYGKGDGTPGATSLTRLAEKHGINVHL